MSDGATILYFSTYCNNCSEFLTRLQKHPNLNDQIVKAQTGKHRFPPYIKSVPTIQIPDPNAQGKAIIYEGEDAFAWLDDQTSPKTKDGGLMDYDPLAMGGVFGGMGAFAGIDETDDIPNLSMADYNDPNAGNIGVQQRQSLQSGAAKEDEMARRMEKMQEQRLTDLERSMNNGPRGQGPPPPM